MNTFLIRTASFMNNFTTQCENKLERLDTRLKKMDTALTLLEAKVNNKFFFLCSFVNTSVYRLCLLISELK